jgi:hypothetical protein
MPRQPSAKVPTLTSLLQKLEEQSLPLTGKCSVFCIGVTLTEDEEREYLHDPVAALPPSLMDRLPSIRIVLVPYMTPAQKQGEVLVHMTRPSGDGFAWEAFQALRGALVLCFAVGDVAGADYHYRFFRSLAVNAAISLAEDKREEFSQLLRQELANNVHGEVDEQGWQLKQKLLATGSKRTKATPVKEYLQTALVDTLTLYLHGICCDIDVEPGPRQLASRHLRKRLKLLQSFFPPPDGYAVLPEDLRSNHKH